MRLTSTAVLIGASLALQACEETRVKELPRSDGAITFVERTTYGGGAAGYIRTELGVRFGDDGNPQPIGFVRHGGMHASWTANGALQLCFDDTPEWIFYGELRKGYDSVQITECI